METEIISRAALPALTEDIKQAIGFSIWKLYRIHCSGNDEIKYLLETTDNSYLLCEGGEVLKPKEDEEIQIIRKVLIEGFVIPSNIKLNNL